MRLFYLDPTGRRRYVVAVHTTTGGRSTVLFTYSKRAAGELTAEEVSEWGGAIARALNTTVHLDTEGNGYGDSRGRVQQ